MKMIGKRLRYYQCDDDNINKTKRSMRQEEKIGWKKEVDKYIDDYCDENYPNCD